jgi:hypothetical protein
MRFRIRTLQVLIVLIAPPIGVVCEGAKAGFVVPVLVVWVVLVAVPLVLMCAAERWVKREAARDCASALFAAIAIVGYSCAIPISFLVISALNFRAFS